ncbi:MAG TPA: N-acetylmuramoyl-L-alanine amidase [Thermomicrobiales bacterium]|nr:N-acetylmuramoyl-L-alanine amidase [Thermomicrobiales bacterium]
MTDRVFTGRTSPKAARDDQTGRRAATPPRTTTWRTESGGRGAGGRSVMIGAVLFLGLTVVFAGVGRPDSDSRGALRSTAVLTEPAVANDLIGFAPNQPPREQGSGQSAGVSAAADLNGDGVPVVCLDPGHGGGDPGFTRSEKGDVPRMNEADLNLEGAVELARRLENHGIVVVMTRRDDVAVNAEGADVNGDGETFDAARRDGKALSDAMRVGDFDELQARINICNRADADLLVSMHVNGYDERTTVRGYEAWYTGCREFGEQSERFAVLAYDALSQELTAAGFETEPRGLKNDCVADVDPSDPLLAHNMIITGPEVPGKIAPSEMPGAIIETLFLSNEEDARFLASEAGRDAIIKAYERAILAYFQDGDATNE